MQSGTCQMQFKPYLNNEEMLQIRNLRRKQLETWSKHYRKCKKNKQNIPSSIPPLNDSLGVDNFVYNKQHKTITQQKYFYLSLKSFSIPKNWFPCLINCLILIICCLLIVCICVWFLCAIFFLFFFWYICKFPYKIYNY